MSLHDYRIELNAMERVVFDEMVSIGILRTIAALYDADVADPEIIRVVSKYWEVDEESVRKMLVAEKIEATINALVDYLKCIGFSDTKINDFLADHNVRTKVREEHALWKMKNKPEKLYEAVQKKKVRKERK